MLKAVILIGGPQKGTRFRPLSFDSPKPLFPVAGRPMVQHLIESCTRVPNLREILLIGFYPQVDESLTQFINSMQREYNIQIRYLQEYTSLGTAGGIFHFRDQIRRGEPEAFFLINGDVCGEFPLSEMLDFHRRKRQNLSSSNASVNNQPLVTVLATEATRQQSVHYGCIVENRETNEVMHYVEKPSTFVSTIINGGVYLCSLDIFQYIANIFKQKHQDAYADGSSDDDVGMSVSIINGVNGGVSSYNGDKPDCIRLEQDVLRPLAGTGSLYVFQTTKWWSQIKTAASAIYANRHYLELFHKTRPEILAISNSNGVGPEIIGDVFIHPTAVVDRTAVIGPNVSIGQGVTIGAGVRIRESIVLRNATIYDHSLILHSIVGWNCTVGPWTRVEGTPCDPNPNKAFAKMENQPLFNGEGKLNPSITVLGCNVQVLGEVIVLNSIVLPHKELGRSYKNEIIL